MAPAGSSFQPLLITIKKGDSSLEVAQSLREFKLIKSSFLFVLFSQVQPVRFGTYELSYRMNLLQILHRLSSGQTYKFRITIPEGYTLYQIAAELEKLRLVSSRGDFILAAHQPEKFAAAFPFLPQSGTLEGYLFPDTYFFEKGNTTEQIIFSMLKRFMEKLPKGFGERAHKREMNVHEFVTLASLVEKEAIYDKERPKIASVLLNRLKKGQYLQCDATVQYILSKDRYKRLTYSDLKVNSPYNTYLHKGLPPGAISNPGRASLLAVMYPAPTPYFYYVAKPDSTHVFSRTYQEHLNAIKRIRSRGQ